MWRGNGEWICRPLNNPQKLQFNAYTDNNPKGFGLLQLDRDFSHYQGHSLAGITNAQVCGWNRVTSGVRAPSA
ncbi:glucan biosynthesis protein [Escherichia coli]